MTRPAARYTYSDYALSEQHDRAHVAELGSYGAPLNPANIAATSDLDSLTRAAGLAGGWAALYGKMVATGKRLPGHVSIAGVLTETGQTIGHVVRGDDRLALMVRGWALENAPDLIDDAAEQSQAIASVKFSWW